jgi:hypothetical protein
MLMFIERLIRPFSVDRPCYSGYTAATDFLGCVAMRLAAITAAPPAQDIGPMTSTPPSVTCAMSADHRGAMLNIT